MKLKMITLLLVTTVLSAGLCSNADAQGYGHGTRRGYTVYAPDSAFEKYYNYDYYNWRYHPRRYYRHKYRMEKHYHDYYYNERYRRNKRYYGRWDDEKYYYRGGGH